MLLITKGAHCSCNQTNSGAADNLTIHQRSNTIQYYPTFLNQVSHYRVTWRKAEEGSKPSELIVPHDPGADEHFAALSDLDDAPGSVYKVNVWAVVRFDAVDADGSVADAAVESRELHEKFLVKDGGDLVVYVEET